MHKGASPVFSVGDEELAVSDVCNLALLGFTDCLILAVVLSNLMDVSWAICCSAYAPHCPGKYFAFSLRLKVFH